MIKNIIDLLREHEGVRHHVYDDATGKSIVAGTVVQGNPTVGVGRLLTEGRGLSDDEIDYLLTNDLELVEDELDVVFPDWQDLADGRRNVLISMMFNMGRSRFLTFKKFWRAMEQQDYETAASEMLLSRWADQVKDRAVELAEMMRKGESYGIPD